MKKSSILLLQMFFVYKLHAAHIINIFGTTQQVKCSQYCNSRESADSSPIQIVKNYSAISSISELLDMFNGKPVFIDLWATWCSPCIQEFKFSSSLYTFLEKNGVVIIYVSFDNDQQDLDWRKMIEDNKLSGYHVRANKKLKDDFTTLVWGSIDAFSIPNYILFDKDKNVVNKSASHPSSSQTLFKQIEKIL